MATKKKKKKKKTGKRKRRAPDKGKPIRLSSTVIRQLMKYQRTKEQGKAESFDSILRRLFGLPTRGGQEQLLKTIWIVPGVPKIYEDEADAAGAAVLDAVTKKRKKTKKVKQFRECP